MSRARRYVAIHEAGHAVVGYFNDLPPKRIVIGKGRDAVEADALGYVERKFRYSRHFRDRLSISYPNPADFDLVRRMVMALAAGAAANWHDQERRGRFWRPGSESDVRAAQDLADRIHGGNNELGIAFVHYCIELAKVEIRHRWPYVEAVADALLRKGFLTYEAFRQVVYSESEHQMAIARARIKTAGDVR